MRLAWKSYHERERQSDQLGMRDAWAEYDSACKEAMRLSAAGKKGSTPEEPRE